MIMAAICIVAVLIVLYILSSSRCEYYVYKDKTDTEDNVDVSYETFADGYLKYSSNGIEFQKKFGRSEWNVALSYVHPFFTKSDSYAVLGDKGENSLILFNKNGKVKELTLKYPLVQATVSDQGIIEVILEGTNSNYIQVYAKNGELIADMRSSVEETGYPVTAAISPDGTQLAVSYYSISGMNSKTSIVFYDFSRQLQSDDVTLKGGFDYESALIPKLSFVDKNTVAAFGNSATYFYNIEDTPKVKKEIQFTQEIESVFENDKYELGFLSKVLNSAIMDYYVQNTSYSIEGGYYCYQKKYIEKFSLPVFTKAEIEYVKERDQVDVDQFLIKKYGLIF